MSNREASGLRGPVRSVVEEFTDEHVTTMQEKRFDEAGRLMLVRHGNPDGTVREIECIEPAVRILPRAGGGHTEIADIAGIDAWTREGLHSTGFGTFGASLAETAFDSAGRPVETLFTGAEGRQFSRINYTCDESGRILDAASELFRIEFRYDAAGRLAEKTMYFAGQLRDHTVITYNEHGDMSTYLQDNQPQANFEYD